MYTIYGLIDPVSKELRYIGKSCNLKARYKQHLKGLGVSYKAAWVRKLQPLVPELLVLEQHTTEEEAYAAEVEWISMCRSWGARLTNTCIGGQGGFDGVKHTPEAVAKIKSWRARNPQVLSDVGRQRIANNTKALFKGKAKTEEHKSKLREVNLLRWKQLKEARNGA